MASVAPDSVAEATGERAFRYPGVQPFGDDDIQRQLFRGRDEEKYEFLQLVLAERLVLLFARSGIGKSSLINAGLLEPLREKSYFPMVVRVSGLTGNPLDCLYASIKASIDQGVAHRQIEYEPAEDEWNRASLWHFFKTLELWQGDRLLTPVVIIDQFEELFTLHAVEQRKQLIHELADLIRGTRPRDTLTDVGPNLSEMPPEVKVVFALREDFYANIEELRDRIPLIYKTPFRLNPLSREEAKRAILEPAELEGEHFSTPAFSWADDSLDMVLDFLSEQQLGEGKTIVGSEVEPFQLQLICQHVEDTVREQQLRKVTLDDLGGADALKAILGNFYEDSLRKICSQFPEEQDLRERLEQLCEYGLITARGRRLLREESTIKQDDGVGPEILREMVELRLLRKEPRVGDNYYELTHDTLIEPIQLSRQTREEQAALKAEHRKMRSRLIVAALVVLVLIGLWTFKQWKDEQAAVRQDDLVRQRFKVELQKVEKKALAEKQENKSEIQKVEKKALAEKEKAEAEKEKAEAEKEKALAEKEKALAEKEKAEVQAEIDKAKEKSVDSNQKNEILEMASLKLEKANQEIERAKKAILEAEKKVKVTDAEAEVARAKREVVEAKAKLLEIEPNARATQQQLATAKQQLAAAEQQLAKATEADKAEKKEQVEAAKKRWETANDNYERISQAYLKTSEEVKNAEVVLLDAKKKGPGAEAEELSERSQLTEQHIELERSEADPKINYAELAKKYEKFLETSRQLSDDKVKKEVEDRIRHLNEFAERDRRDSQLSVCEQFDSWTAYQPPRPLSPEARHRDERLAQLNALLQESAVVITHNNFITSGGEEDENLMSVFTHDQDRVYMHAWVTSPRVEALRATIMSGDSEETPFRVKGLWVYENPLRGDKIGYHVWHWRNPKALGKGKHELRLYNQNEKLICRREFEIQEPR